MNFEIKFTPEAEETYDAVLAQIRQQWGDSFVMKFELIVSKRLNTISSTPYLYPIAVDNMNLRRCVLHKNCSMLYKVFDDIVLVICFWDNRQDPLFA